MRSIALPFRRDMHHYRVRVWDLPTRLFHWALLVCFVGVIASGLISGDAMIWHFRFAYACSALLIFRFLWGFFGGHWSRFAHFSWHWKLSTPPIVNKNHHTLFGHSFLGSISVISILFLLLLQISTGLFTDDDILYSGPLAKFSSSYWVGLLGGYHREVGKLLLIAITILHIGAIVFYKIRKKQNLTETMLTGDREIESLHPINPMSSSDTTQRRIVALLLFAFSMGLVLGFRWWVGDL